MQGCDVITILFKLIFWQLFFSIYFNESALKVMKYTLYFMLKALFIFELFTFLCWYFGYLVKRRDKKAMFNFKSYDVVTIHILPNISRSKGNQTTKFGQLIEYTMRNVFLEESWAKCREEASLRPFYKKSKLSFSLDEQSGMV